MRRHHKILIIAIFSVILLLGFAVPVNMVGSWYQQFMPNLGGRQIVDITFTDSLNGYAIINRLTLQDTSFILRTTNSGDNWNFIYSDSGVTYSSLKFINQNTGFVGGYIYKGGSFKLVKTTNAGLNWFYIDAPFDVPINEISAISQDMIWLASSSNPTGGVFFTSNGGGSWTNQLSLGNLNPEKIYMYNARIGFISKNMGSSGYVRKTTDSGASWNVIVSNDYFLKIYFADSLTGWKNSAFGMKKTINGGLNWVTETIPFGGIIVNSFIYDFSGLNKDTLWGTGGYVLYPNNETRGILYRTTDGGDTWLFQIPDTSIDIGYSHIRFKGRMHGWVYDTNPTGIHTTTGGDPVWLTGIKQISSQVPDNYKLYQNYPNPFNPQTIIKYQIVNNKYQKKANVILKIFDIAGREVITLVNEEQSAGTYAVDFSGTGYSSGVYFYSLIIDEVSVDTKKMVLIK